MIAGLVAGLLAFALAYVVGEPSIDDSIALEETQSAPAHQHGDASAGSTAGVEEDELVTRPVQSTFGLATGVLVYAVALGGLASLAFAVCLGRVGRLRPRATAVLLAGAAFGTICLVPFLKYPPTPPAVGNPDTIGTRTSLFFLMIAFSVLVAVIAVITGRRLAPKLGNWNATVAAGAGYVVVVAVACLLLPGNADAVKETFPAALLWEFRLASLGVQALLWTAFGLVFGALAERALRPPEAVAEEATLPAEPARTA